MHTESNQNERPKTRQGHYDGLDELMRKCREDDHELIYADLVALFEGKSKETAAVADVLAERRRQIEQEGWHSGHDDAHQPGVLAAAASRYSTNAAACLGFEPPCLAFGANWPWNESWFKPTTPRRDLVKAAALILAEIERIDRAEKSVPHHPV